MLTKIPPTPFRFPTRDFRLGILLLLTIGPCQKVMSQNSPNEASPSRQQAKNADKPKKETREDSKTWTSLFDGKTLKGWTVSKFGGEGEVAVKEGTLVLEMGSDLTGVTRKDGKKLPLSNYEIALQAKRIDGIDFFCGLTFPVKNDPCSLIIGGWGGGVCGLSSIDGYDASENATTTYRTFKSGRWYRIRLRVTDARIQAWLDDELLVNQEIANRKISIRSEVELSRPLGIAAWQTVAGLKDLKIRSLTPEEIAAAKSTKK